MTKKLFKLYLGRYSHLAFFHIFPVCVFYLSKNIEWIFSVPVWTLFAQQNKRCLQILCRYGAFTTIGQTQIEPFILFVCFCVSAFEASTSVAKKCHQEFEQVKAKRFSLFSQCFEHVSVAINQIYKRLCKNDSAQVRLAYLPLSLFCPHSLSLFR